MLRCSNAILSLQRAIRQRVAEGHRDYEDRTRKDGRAGRGNVEETAASANQKTNQKADKNFHFSFTPFRFDPEHSESAAPTVIPPTQNGKAMDHASVRAPTAAPPRKATIAVPERLIESPGVPAIANPGRTLSPARGSLPRGFVYQSWCLRRWLGIWKPSALKPFWIRG